MGKNFCFGIVRCVANFVLYRGWLRKDTVLSVFGCLLWRIGFHLDETKFWIFKGDVDCSSVDWLEWYNVGSVTGMKWPPKKLLPNHAGRFSFETFFDLSLPVVLHLIVFVRRFGRRGKIFRFVTTFCFCFKIEFLSGWIEAPRRFWPGRKNKDNLNYI